MAKTGLENKLYTSDQVISIFGAMLSESLKKLRQLPATEIVRCKDCIHKPRYRDPDDLIKNDGFDIIFPDSICPCQCDDGWYNWMPKDNFYCACAERRTDERT